MKLTPNKPPSLKEIDLLRERLATGGINDWQQINFCLLIRGACQRPQVYVGKQSFELVAAFLDGYDHALDHQQAKPRSWGLREFGYWLGPQLNHSTSLHWGQMMMKSYPDETEAFAQLPGLYEEFLLHQAKALS